MPYDEALVKRVRTAMASRTDVSEKRMFGGIAFMVSGHMACGVAGEELMVRVGPGAYEEALRLPHAQEMRFTGRPMRGFVMVRPEGVATAKAVAPWVERCLAFVSTLPPKR